MIRFRTISTATGARGWSGCRTEAAYRERRAFHLLDLTSQALAVQRLLHGRGAEEKLDWLAARGHLERVATSVPNARPTWRFV